MAKIKVRVKKDSPAADIIKAAKEEKQAFKEAVESGNNKQQTAVEWLEQKLKDRYSLIHSQPLFEQAKQMEKEQLENARPQIISNCVIKEISDDEIEKAAWDYEIKEIGDGYNHHFVEGARWYREQLRNKQ